MNAPATPTPSDLSFLSGGGELGDLIRAHDWARSSLGPAAHWPQTLRTALRLILNSGHPMYIWWGPDLLCFYNDAYRRSIGPERHPSSVGMPGREVWAEIWPIIGPQIERVMTGQGATWHENQLVPITRDGKLEDVYWTYSYSPLDDATAPHGVGGVLVVCSETTSTVVTMKQQAEEIVRMREMFAQAPSFTIIMSGPGHRVEFVNDAHRRLFGSDRWIGKPLREAFPDISGQGFYELLDGVYATGEIYRSGGVPVRFRPAGSDIEDTRILDFIYAPIYDHARRITGVFCEGFDVSKEIETQTALRRSEERLRIADRRKDEFLATLAHELRNPLAPIVNAASLLQHPSIDREQIIRFSQMIERQTRAMTVLLDDLLEVARISTGKILLRRKSVSAASLVEAALEPVRHALESKQHTLRIEMQGGEVLVNVDPIRISQVLTNLLTNAIKYSDRGGDILLKVDAGPGEVRFEVADNGIGLSSEQMSTIFDMFSQVSTTVDRSEGGLGIGLAVAKALVEMHGGRIEAASSGLEMGSRFSITIPRGGADEGIAADEQRATTTATAASLVEPILVADDNVDAAESLAVFLELEGYKVHIAYDGVAALEIASQVRPVACFLDIGMPGLDGLEVAKRLRARHDGGGMLLVATTGWGKPEDRRQSAEAGFDLHLTKPVDLALAARLLASRSDAKG